MTGVRRPDRRGVDDSPVMVSVAFQLPLDPQQHFAPAALAQLAMLIEGKPIYAAVTGIDADDATTIGRVQTAVVDGDRVQCTAAVEQRWAELAGGYGVEAMATSIARTPNSTRAVIEGLRWAKTVLVRPLALPLGARRPVALDAAMYVDRSDTGAL